MSRKHHLLASPLGSSPPTIRTPEPKIKKLRPKSFGGYHDFVPIDEYIPGNWRRSIITENTKRFIPAQHGIDITRVFGVSSYLQGAGNEHAAFFKASRDFFKNMAGTQNAPVDFFAGLIMNARGIEAFLREQDSGLVSQELMEEYMASRQAIRFSWTEAARHYVADEVDDLLKPTIYPPEITESTWHQVLQTLQCLAPSAPANIDEKEWSNVATMLLPSDFLMYHRQRLARAYRIWQDQTYARDEKSKLWLLVWRALSRLAHFPDDFLLDHRVNALREEVFNLRFIGPMVCQEAAEELVGRYCLYVQKEQQKSSSHNSPAEAVTEADVKNLRALIAAKEANTETFQLLDKVVQKLNNLTDGAAILHRPNVRSISTEWTVETFPKFNARVLKDGIEGAKVDDYITAADTIQNKVRFHEPEGFCEKSGFDYVYYPFGETRAHEVAQNEQITREMSEPGIYSDGPREQYVLNVAPPHAKHPKDVSYLPRLRMVGPAAVGYAICRYLMGKKKRRLARPRPPLTSRPDPRRPRNMSSRPPLASTSSKSASPASNRVTKHSKIVRSKSVSAAKTLQGISENISSDDLDNLPPVPRLRGGGGGGRNSSPQESLTLSKGSSNSSQIEVAEFNVDQLRIHDHDFDSILTLTVDRGDLYYPYDEWYVTRNNGQRLTIVLDADRIVTLVDAQGLRYQIYYIADLRRVYLLEPDEVAPVGERYLPVELSPYPDDEEEPAEREHEVGGGEESTISSTVPPGLDRRWTPPSPETRRSPRFPPGGPAGSTSSPIASLPSTPTPGPLVPQPLGHTPPPARTPSPVPIYEDSTAGSVHPSSPERDLYDRRPFQQSVGPGIRAETAPSPEYRGPSPPRPEFPPSPPSPIQPPLCHRCPVYLGQYHHICHMLPGPHPFGRCPGMDLPGPPGPPGRSSSSHSSDFGPNGENEPPLSPAPQSPVDSLPDDTLTPTSFGESESHDGDLSGSGALGDLQTQRRAAIGRLYQNLRSFRRIIIHIRADAGYVDGHRGEIFRRLQSILADTYTLLWDVGGPTRLLINMPGMPSLDDLSIRPHPRLPYLLHRALRSLRMVLREVNDTGSLNNSNITPASAHGAQLLLAYAVTEIRNDLFSGGARVLYRQQARNGAVRSPGREQWSEWSENGDDYGPSESESSDSDPSDSEDDGGPYPLPTGWTGTDAATYEAWMLRDEMRAELEHRGIVVRGNQTIAQLAQLLEGADNVNNLGRGYQRSFRQIQGLAVKGRRPQGFQYP